MNTSGLEKGTLAFSNHLPFLCMQDGAGRTVRFAVGW